MQARRADIDEAMEIVRRIDDLGRVVSPKETCRTMRIRDGGFLSATDTKNEELSLKSEGLLVLRQIKPLGISDLSGV